MTSVGKRLAEERRRLNLTQEDLAQAMGVGRAAVTMVETERTGLSSFHSDALMKLGIDMTFVRTGIRKASAIADDINWELVEGILEALEKWSRQHKVKLTPDKLAKALRVLYTYFSSTGQINPQHLEHVMALAA